jgi:hypothetical protein
MSETGTLAQRSPSARNQAAWVKNKIWYLCKALASWVQYSLAPFVMDSAMPWVYKIMSWLFGLFFSGDIEWLRRFWNDNTLPLSLILIGVSVLVTLRVYRVRNPEHFQGTNNQAQAQAWKVYGGTLAAVLLVGCCVLAIWFKSTTVAYPGLPVTPPLQCADMTTRCVERPHFIAELQIELSMYAGCLDRQKEKLRIADIAGSYAVQQEITEEGRCGARSLDQLERFRVAALGDTSTTKRLIHAAAQQDAERRWAKEVPEAVAKDRLGQYLLGSPCIVCYLSKNVGLSTRSRHHLELLRQQLVECKRQVRRTTQVALRLWLETRPQDRFLWVLQATGKITVWDWFTAEQEAAAVHFIAFQTYKIQRFEAMLAALEVYKALLEQSATTIHSVRNASCMVVDTESDGQGLSQDYWLMAEGENGSVHVCTDGVVLNWHEGVHERLSTLDMIAYIGEVSQRAAHAHVWIYHSGMKYQDWQ